MSPLSFLARALLRYAACLTKEHDEPMLTASVQQILSFWRSKGEITRETERTLSKCWLKLLGDAYDADSWSNVEEALLAFSQQIDACLAPQTAAA